MVEESKSSNRNLIIILALAALGLALVAGIAVAAVVLSNGDSGEGAETAQSATIMPADTLMFASFNPHLDQAENFAVVEQAWGDSPIVQMGLGEMLSSMEKDGFDYKSDIEPWLGSEISFGMVGDLAAMMLEGVEMSFSGIPGQAPQAGEMPAVPQFTIAAATTDKAASDAFLNKLRTAAEQEGTIWQEIEYKGIQIVHSEQSADGEPGIAYATVNDFVIVAVGGLEPMQAIIDAQETTNLTDNQDYKDVMSKLPAGQIGYGYLDVGAYMDAVLKAAESDLAGIAPALMNFDQYKAFRGAGYSVGLEPNGLRVDFSVVYDPDALPEDIPGSQAIDDKVAQRVPANTLLYASGSGLGSVVQGALDAMASMPDQAEDLEEQMAMMTAMLGVSVDELIQMLSGEFGVAIAHNPAGLGGDASVPMGFSFLLEAEDEEQFKDLLNSVSGLLGLGAGMELQQETIGGVEVTTVPGMTSEDFGGGVCVGNGFLVIATSRQLLETAFGGGGDKLADTTLYGEAIAPLPKNRASMFFMNVDQWLEVMPQAMGPAESESFDEARPLLEPIKAMSAATEPFDTSKDAMSGTFFILIESE